MAPTVNSPQIDPNFLCSAWVNSHFPHHPLPESQPSAPLLDPVTVARSPALCPDSSASGSSESHEDPHTAFHRIRNAPAPFSLPTSGPAGWDHSGSGGGAAAGRAGPPVPEPRLELDPRQSAAGSFVEQLLIAPSTSTKRKAKTRESSPSKGGGSVSDTRHKRVALEMAEPSGFLGTPDPTKHRPTEISMPENVKRLLQRFSPAVLEVGCMPQTPEIDALLEHSFSHEFLLGHNRLAVPNSTAPTAVALVKAAILIHRTSLYNSRNGEDEAAWYPVVRRLLSAQYDGSIPALPPIDAPLDEDDFFQTIDATTKPTTSALPPSVNIKLDCLIVFNGRHDPSVHRALRNNIRLNAFADATLERKIVALGVEVKAPSGGGQIDAEYQLAVWGMKTLHLTKQLAVNWDPRSACNVAVGISVCGHVWSMHITYWRGDGALVTHGPVCIGVTDTLYGTMKILKWVCLFKVWAEEEAWADWKSLLDGLIV